MGTTLWNRDAGQFLHTYDVSFSSQTTDRISGVPLMGKRAVITANVPAASPRIVGRCGGSGHYGGLPIAGLLYVVPLW